MIRGIPTFKGFGWMTIWPASGKLLDVEAESMCYRETGCASVVGGSLGLRWIRTNSHDHLDHPGRSLHGRRHVARRDGATEKSNSQ
jgi:hypothetical protein